MVTTRHITAARHNERGFTLTELLIVLAIAVVLATVAGRYLTRTDNANQARKWAYKIWVTAKAARSLALNSGSATRLLFDPNDTGKVTLQKASVGGVGPPATATWLDMSMEEAGATAAVAAVQASTNLAPGATPSTWCAASPCVVLFQPDGRATAATVYVEDSSGKYKHRVAVYSLTGFVQHVEM